MKQQSPIALSFAALFLLAGLTSCGERARTLAADNPGWSDRRPIAAIFLARSGQGWEKNPRGYFADPHLDVRTDEGRAELRRRMMDLADRTIQKAREVGAQGVVVWDIEGGEMPHAVTYLGDPLILQRVAPEMDAIADEFFARFIEAGLRTGICIRPTRIVFRDEGSYPWIKGRYGHTDTNDPAGVLSEKIAYAKKRWGCTNFYIDTNVTPRIENGQMVRKKSGSPDMRLLTAEEIARVQRAHPDVLLWPEFQEPDYFATSSGYGEFHRVGEFSAKERLQYPDAFRVWMTRVHPEDLYLDWQRFLDNGPAKGEIFLFETAPVIGPMAEVLRNAASELALRARQTPFVAPPDAAARIARLKASTDWAERRVLVETLGADTTPEATEVLADLLRKETDGLQWFAAHALGRQSTPQSLPVLRELGAKAGNSQAAAVRGLGASSDPSVTAYLLQRLEDKTPSIRWAALDALGERADPASGPALRAHYESIKGSSAVMSTGKVIQALGRVGDKESIPLLQAAEKDPAMSRHRRFIKEALTRLGAATP